MMSKRSRIVSYERERYGSRVQRSEPYILCYTPRANEDLNICESATWSKRSGEVQKRLSLYLQISFLLNTIIYNNNFLITSIQLGFNTNR